jgi:hypothetical protein
MHHLAPPLFSAPRLVDYRSAVASAAVLFDQGYPFLIAGAQQEDSGTRTNAQEEDKKDSLQEGENSKIHALPVHDALAGKDD